VPWTRISCPNTLVLRMPCLLRRSGPLARPKLRAGAACRLNPPDQAPTTTSQVPYEHRVGRPIAVGRLLPIRRLLSQIPEIGTQIDTVNLGHTRGGRIQQALAQDGQNWWSLLAFWTQYPLTEGANVTARRLRRYFRPVKPPTQWRDDIFVVGPATTGMPQCFESKLLIPKLSNSTVPREVFDLVKPIRDIIGMSTGGAARDGGSAALAPSFYETSAPDAAIACSVRLDLLRLVTSKIQTAVLRLDPTP